MSSVVIANPNSIIPPEDALRMLPRERLGSIQSPSAEDLFPPSAWEGMCRVCGKVAKLTREHIPPKASGNSGRTRAVSLERWLESDDLDVEPDGRIIQGGITGYMLCAECNNITGAKWGTEYKTWAVGFARLIWDMPESPDDLGARSGYIYLPRVKLRRMHPGRLVRQVLTMMLCVSGSPELGADHPELRDLVLGGSPRQLPEGMRLFMCPCLGPSARFVGGRWGAAMFDGSEQRWSFALEVAVPPLAFQLILDGDGQRWGTGADISHFTRIDPDDEQDLVAEQVILGFTYSAYACDYRSKGQMLAEAGDTLEQDE